MGQLQCPIIEQSIVKSLLELVSPPRMLIPNSLAAIRNPCARPLTVCNEIDFGSPNESIHDEGSIPLAAKSLIQDTMLFLEICQGLIHGGTSVLPTNMSHLRANNLGSLDLPRLTSATSSKGKGCF
jgi:hypothetical protein